MIKNQTYHSINNTNYTAKHNEDVCLFVAIYLWDCKVKKIITLIFIEVLTGEVKGMGEGGQTP